MAVSKPKPFTAIAPSPLETGNFSACMDALGLDALPGKIAVAVSGGADSMALALLAADWAAEVGIQLHALTVDHGIRPESARESRQVAGWMAGRGIAHTILTHEGDMNGNLQAAARDARYSLMGEWCAEHGVSHLMVAHHMEDQAETFLIRLGRGSGVDGLAAMHPVRTQNGITLLRPLLGISKAELVATLQARGQFWVEDPSNRNPDFTRTHMRGLLPQLADAGISPAKLATTAKHMARAQDFLHHTADAACTELITPTDDGLLLDRTRFAALHPEIALRVLALVIRRMTGDVYRPRFDDLQRLYDTLCDLPKNVARTLAGCQFRSHMNGVVLVSKETCIKK